MSLRPELSWVREHLYQSPLAPSWSLSALSVVETAAKGPTRRHPAKHAPALQAAILGATISRKRQPAMDHRMFDMALTHAEHLLSFLYLHLLGHRKEQCLQALKIISYHRNRKIKGNSSSKVRKRGVLSVHLPESQDSVARQ